PAAVVAVCMLALARPAAALTPEVHDNAGFFSADALHKADAIIKEIKQDYKEDLLIETYKTIPPEKQEAFKSEGKEKFFQQWALERARAAGITGVYILICKDPGHLQIEVGNNTRKRAF